MKTVSIWIGTVSFVATLLSLYQFFASDTRFEKIDFFYDCDDKSPQPVFRFLRDLYDNQGKTVILKLQIPTQCNHVGIKNVFRRLQRSDVIRWSFEQCDLAAMWNITCSFPANAPPSVFRAYAEAMDTKFGGGKVDYKTYTKFVPDNGASLEIQINQRSTNALSWVEVNTESYDIAEGPFQIAIGKSDGHNIILLSPAPYSERLEARVKCAESRLPNVLRPLICPFF